MKKVSLKEYVERMFEERDKAINLAFTAAKEAVTLAERNAEKWREHSNAWRGAMSDRERTFVTKTEFEASDKSKNERWSAGISNIQKQFESMQKEVDVVVTWKNSSQGSFKVISWMLGILMAIVIGLVVAFYTKTV